jgi:hypothetical protein
MRKLILAILAVTAVGTTTLTTSAPAVARDFPWCTQGRGVGFPGNCRYMTRAQCMASASGRNVTCGKNPRVAFGRQRGSGAHRSAY